MKKIKSFDGVMINYDYREKSSSLPVMVFLHGVGGNLTLWNKEVKLLNKKDYSTLAIDLRGHGLSDMPKKEIDYCLQNYVKDLRVVLKKEKVANYVLIGHSFGGSLIIAYLASYKDILPCNLVLVESTYHYPYAKDHDLNLNPLVVYLMNTLIARGWFERYPYEIDFSNSKRINKYKEELYHLPIRSIFFALHEARLYSQKNKKKIAIALGNLNLPTLIVAGDKDTTIDPNFSLEINKLIKNSKFVVFKGIGHMLPVLKYRRLCKEIIKFI